MAKVTKTSPDPPSILQKLANIYNWRENLAENIYPFGYSGPGITPGDKYYGEKIMDPISRLYNAIVLDKDENPYYAENYGYGADEDNNKERVDLLNMILGREQKYNTIKKSTYKPTKSTDLNAEYYRSQFTEDVLKSILTDETLRTDPISPEKLLTGKNYGRPIRGNIRGVLGEFVMDHGKDEKGPYISYYDKWDLNPLSSESTSGNVISRDLENKIQSAVGIKPAEIYGRVYYDPKTGKPIESKKDGGRIRKYQDGGGIFKKLRQKRTDRRIAKTPVRDASSQEVLEMLASYGADSPMMQGEYDPREKEIVMYKDDLDTLKHEQVHAAQYGPLQRLAYRMNQDRSAPIQDPTKRKVYRKLSENISPEAYAAFNRAGKLILDKGEEFEAVLDTGVNAAKEKGVNFNVSFEEILSQLKNIPSPTNNMIGLMKFMENRFTREQRDLILKSIR